MFELSQVDFSAMIITFLYISTRVSAFVISSPIIGTKMLISKTKMILILSLSFVLVSVVPTYPQVKFLTLETLLIVGSEFLIGLCIGMAVALLFQVFVMMGEIVAMQAGLGMAVMNDPSSNSNIPVISQFFLMMISVIFFFFDGHLRIIQLLANSYNLLPIGMSGIDPEGFKRIAMLCNWMFANAFRLAIPMITALLMVQISLGVMTKSAPQLNIFSIGFPITMILGMIVLYLNVDSVMPQFITLFEYITEFLNQEILVRAGA